MLKLAYFSFDDVRFPSPVIRVFAPNLMLAPRVALLSGLTVMGERQHHDPDALRQADIVLVQRGFPRRATGEICDAILGCGKPVIYETDDALQHVPAHHGKPIYGEDVGPAVDAFASRAHLVTVSTPALKELFAARARRVAVLPNYLSPDLWTDELPAPPPAPGRVRIGFVGSRNHDRDLATIAAVLREALERYEHVDVVSYGGIASGLEGCPRVRTIPAHYDYAGHPARLAAAGNDVAVAPLEPSRFNRCKSNIKFLEFGFLGIPGIYAALEPYGSVRHGETGFLCDGAVAWREALFALIEDAGLRSRIGAAAREEVRGAWMLDAHKEQWMRAYMSTVN